eukprot:GILK01001750.1.p1 GENE.GILK01001750.1~~GILK01001750.1.p1  ORF type:complete len:367 (-),score=102.84 GILK01001750.1:158-1258(-)
MPPKNSGTSKKTVEKAKAKVVEDKTFGLKNKNKSKVVQKFIKNVSQAVKNPGKSETIEKAKQAAKKEEKKKELETNALLASLFKSAVTIKQQQPKAGEDAKSVLCAFFKAGTCTKGDKCKYSHDLNIERKSAKIDLYTDQRDVDAETMENWDINKLQSVVNTKHGAPAGKHPTTEIVCKYFLDAVESRLYGWFWNCPNGEDCKYRHALPPGFVLREKKVKVEEEEEVDETPLEEIIEAERSALPSGGTPVTLESFTRWKEEKARRRAEEVETRRQAEAKKTGGRGLGVLSGRDLFSYDPSLFVDDADAIDEAEYEVQEEQVDEDGQGDTTESGAIQENLFLEGADELPDEDDLDVDDEEAKEEEDQ